MTKPTYAEIAADFDLWREYADVEAVISREDFDALSLEERIALQVTAWGSESAEEPPLTRDQWFQAFRYIHNSNDEGDIYLPSDRPERLEISVNDNGAWIHNCAV